MAGPGSPSFRERGHGYGYGYGYDEHRTLKVTAVAAWLAFPHAAAQAIQMAPPAAPREEGAVPRDRLRDHLADRRPGQPAELAVIIRGHWVIEDRLDWFRDLDWDEDLSQVRTASAPRGHGYLEEPRYHDPAAGRLRQHRRITSPPRPQAGLATTNHHELLNDDFAGALSQTPHPEDLLLELPPIRKISCESAHEAKSSA